MGLRVCTWGCAAAIGPNPHKDEPCAPRSPGAGSRCCGEDTDGSGPCGGGREQLDTAGTSQLEHRPFVLLLQQQVCKTGRFICREEARPTGHRGCGGNVSSSETLIAGLPFIGVHGYRSVELDLISCMALATLSALPGVEGWIAAQLG